MVCREDENIWFLRESEEDWREVYRVWFYKLLFFNIMIMII